jgi:ATP-dependent DNA helicase RecG
MSHPKSQPKLPQKMAPCRHQVKAQVDLTALEIRLLKACKDGPKTGRDLVTASGDASRTGNIKRNLEKLKRIGVIEMTIPDKLRSSKQRYILTEKGRRALKRNRWGTSD